MMRIAAACKQNSRQYRLSGSCTALGVMRLHPHVCSVRRPGQRPGHAGQPGRGQQVRTVTEASFACTACHIMLAALCWRSCWTSTPSAWNKMYQLHERSALQGLLRKIGGAGFDGGMPGTGLSHSRFKVPLVRSAIAPTLLHAHMHGRYSHRLHGLAHHRARAHLLDATITSQHTQAP